MPWMTLTAARGKRGKKWLPWRRGILYSPGERRAAFDKVAEAFDRIGHTSKAWAKWLDAFAYCDLDALNEEESEKLQWEATALHYGVGERWRPQPMQLLSKDTVRLRQRWVQDGFKKLAQVPTHSGTKPAKWDIALDGEVWAFMIVKDVMVPECRIHYKFKNSVVEVLLAEGHRFTLCPNCRRPFLKFGKRQYCTPRCSSVGRVRMHRKRRRLQFQGFL